MNRGVLPASVPLAVKANIHSLRYTQTLHACQEIYH
jgi:hypothetical protein